MGNWLRVGPLVIRTGSKHLASWGYPRLKIGGLSFWTRSNDGELNLAGYHPRSSITWLWFLRLTRSGGQSFTHRMGASGMRLQRLPFGWALAFHWQARMPWRRRAV